MRISCLRSSLTIVCSCFASPKSWTPWSVWPSWRKRPPQIPSSSKKSSSRTQLDLALSRTLTSIAHHQSEESREGSSKSRSRWRMQAPKGARRHSGMRTSIHLCLKLVRRWRDWPRVETLLSMARRHIRTGCRSAICSSSLTSWQWIHCTSWRSGHRSTQIKRWRNRSCQRAAVWKGGRISSQPHLQRLVPQRETGIIKGRLWSEVASCFLTPQEEGSYHRWALLTLYLEEITKEASCKTTRLTWRASSPTRVAASVTEAYQGTSIKWILYLLSRLWCSAEISILGEIRKVSSRMKILSSWILKLFLRNLGYQSQVGMAMSLLQMQTPWHQ